MKIFKAFAFTLIAAFALSSCNNVEKILPKKDGLWNVKSIHQITSVDGTVQQDTTMSDQGTMMFNSDGTGVNADNNGGTTEFTWAYDKEADVVSVTQDSLTLENNVLESSSKAQTWQSNLTITIDLGILGTITSTVDITTDLERAE